MRVISDRISGFSRKKNLQISSEIQIAVETAGFLLIVCRLFRVRSFAAFSLFHFTVENY